MPQPYFSVIIPAYNREEMISATLRSVETQTFTDFEVIVVDDGSTDGTVNAAKRFPFVRLISQQNAGPGAARNAGVAAATGKYVAFLDSDDLWFPWTLKRYSETIIEHNDPAFVTGTPACFSDSILLKNVQDTSPVCRSFADYLSAGEQWLWHGVSSFVIRRDVLLGVGGFAEGRINAEDAELALRLGVAPGFVHVSSPPMFGYCIHDGNVTLDREKSIQGLQLLMDNERRGRFPGGRERANDRSVVISRHIRPFAIESAKQGEVAIAFTLYRQVIREALSNYRLRFLLGLPLLSLFGFLKRLIR